MRIMQASLAWLLACVAAPGLALGDDGPDAGAAPAERSVSEVSSAELDAVLAEGQEATPVPRPEAPAPVLDGTRDEDSADPPQPAADGPALFSGFQLGTALGPLYLSEGTRRRGGIGNGLLLKVDLGTAMWEQLAINVGVALVLPEDHQPFTQLAPDCSVTAEDVTCGPDREQESAVQGLLATFELGYQRRWRPAHVISFVPGLMIGYAAGSSELRRGLSCDGCESRPVEGVEARGVYAAPFLRTEFADVIAASVRWQWFASGDLGHALLFGIEIAVFAWTDVYLP